MQFAKVLKILYPFEHLIIGARGSETRRSVRYELVGVLNGATSYKVGYFLVTPSFSVIRANIVPDTLVFQLLCSRLLAIRRTSIRQFDVRHVVVDVVGISHGELHSGIEGDVCE